MCLYPRLIKIQTQQTMTIGARHSWLSQVSWFRFVLHRGNFTPPGAAKKKSTTTEVKKTPF